MTSVDQTMPFNQSMVEESMPPEKLQFRKSLPLFSLLLPFQLGQAWPASAIRKKVDNDSNQKSMKVGTTNSSPRFFFLTLVKTLSQKKHTPTKTQSASAAPEESPPRWAPRTPTLSSRPSRGPRRRSPTAAPPPPSRPRTRGSQSPRSAACTSSSRTLTCRASPPSREGEA